MAEAHLEIKLRRGTSAEWLAANPILMEGEPGVETDTDRSKIGDGNRHWVNLPYYLSEGSIVDLISDVVQTGPEELPDLVLLWENSKA